MTKDEIIDQMIDEMPFNLSENIRTYVKEAMDIYAQQEVKNCNILAVSNRREQLIAAYRYTTNTEERAIELADEYIRDNSN